MANYEKSSLQISEWIANSTSNNRCGTQLILKYKPSVNPLTNFVFMSELRNTYKSIWIEEIDDKFIVRKVNLNERIKLLDNAELEEEVVINKMIGFSSIFKCLTEAKKPIIGHNMIMDLLLMYHHFYRPLPSKAFEAFSLIISSIFFKHKICFLCFVRETQRLQVILTFLISLHF